MAETKYLNINFTKSVSSVTEFANAVQELPKVDLSTSKDSSNIASGLSRLVLCSQISINPYLTTEQYSNNIPIYACVFTSQKIMNICLLRAGIYIHTDRGLVSDHQLFNSRLMNLVGGHDFNELDLANYYQSYSGHLQQSNIVLDPNYQDYLDIENEFWEQNVTPLLDRHKNGFILFAVTNSKYFKENYTHELLHAQYYSSQYIRTCIKECYNDNVSAKSKKIFEESLSLGGYDISQQDLVYREYYSYIMQYNAKEYLGTIKPLINIVEIYDEIYLPLDKLMNEKNIANISY